VDIDEPTNEFSYRSPFTETGITHPISFISQTRKTDGMTYHHKWLTTGLSRHLNAGQEPKNSQLIPGDGKQMNQRAHTGPTRRGKCKLVFSARIHWPTSRAP
jgi:hypothetical protein